MYYVLTLDQAVKCLLLVRVVGRDRPLPLAHDQAPALLLGVCVSVCVTQGLGGGEDGQNDQEVDLE